MRRLMVGVVVLAVLAAACGGGGKSGGGKADTQEAFDPNGVVRIGLNLSANSIGNLDMTKTATPSNFDIIRYAYDTLLHATSKGFEPGLAKEAKVVDPSTVKIE